MTLTLVCVVDGDVYENMAMHLFNSSRFHLHLNMDVKCLLLYGKKGWPDATMYRYHILKSQLPQTKYIFLSDADMRFEKSVGREILPQKGIAATLHPGYVEMDPSHLPYERRPQSVCTVKPRRNDRYYCGGFVGGTREEMKGLCERVVSLIDEDVRNGITPTWHDESALNKVLSNSPPEVTLSPSYCYPDNDTYYKSIWREPYERRLVALDKTEEQRGTR